MFKELAASLRRDDLQRVESGTFNACLLDIPSSEGSKLDLQTADPFDEICQETPRTSGSTREPELMYLMRSQLKPSMADEAALALLSSTAKHQFSEVSAIPLRLSESGFCDTPTLSQAPGYSLGRAAPI